MEQFRQVGEVLGSMKALMVLQEDIQINRRQCCLLLDIFDMAFVEIAAEIKQNLKLEEKNTNKWKALEQPLRELHRVFKEGELYIKYCLEAKEFWSRAIGLHNNKDCVEFHIHNLLSSFPAVVEAIETAGEISGLDPDEMQKKGFLLRKKYDKEWSDPKLFQLRYGMQYLVPKELCKRLDVAWREDRWLLSEALKDKKRGSEPICRMKNDQRLADYLIKKMDASEAFDWTVFPSLILTGAKDYQVRRRLGSGRDLKEIQWLGESFMLRHLFGEVEALKGEISSLLSLSHPNVLQYLCAFYDKEKKESFVVAELMSKTLAALLKENASPRRQTIFPLPVVVDTMLQIARGMEYLHSRKIYHGDLNPNNIFLRSRTGVYFHIKVSGFGLSSLENESSRNSQNQESIDPFIWYAPEILAEQGQLEASSHLKYSEKADVYSFGMICFQLLTGKVPFEDGHLQGGKMSRNIRAGERPLFPFSSPKYLVNLTKRCWQTEPALRPSFSSICRVLRHIKKFLVMNPSNGQPELQSPPIDPCELEIGFQRKFTANGSFDAAALSQIPFQMFAYKLAEIDKTRMALHGIGETPSEVESICKDENLFATNDNFVTEGDSRSIYSDILDKRIPTNKGTSLTIRRIPGDSRSICSDIPDKRIPTDLGTSLKIRRIRVNDPLQPVSDGCTACSETPEKSTPTRVADIKSKNGSVDNPLQPTSDGRSVGLETQKKRAVTHKGYTNIKTKNGSVENSRQPVSDKRSVYSEIPEKRTLSDGRSICSETPEKRTLTPKRCIHITTKRDLVDDPPQSVTNKCSVCSKTPDKRALTYKRDENIKTKKGSVDDLLQTASEKYFIRSETPEKRTLTHKRFTDIKTKKGSATPKAHDERLSPLKYGSCNLRTIKQIDCLAPTSPENTSRGRTRGHVSDSEIR